MQLSDSDFHRMVRFMQDNYGINLKQKRLLINSRLSASLQAQGYTSFKEFVDDLLNKKDKEQIEFVLNKLTTNYTYFMREKDHYDFFMKVILPDITKRNEHKKVLSIWSAGCSTAKSHIIYPCVSRSTSARRLRHGIPVYWLRIFHRGPWRKRGILLMSSRQIFRPNGAGSTLSGGKMAAGFIR